MGKLDIILFLIIFGFFLMLSEGYNEFYTFLIRFVGFVLFSSGFILLIHHYKNNFNNKEQNNNYDKV